MQLTKDAEEMLKDAPGHWEAKDEAGAANRKYLKNMALIKQLDEKKYRLSEVEGEIRAIELKKEQFKTKLIAHIVFIFAFYVMGKMIFYSNIAFSIWFVPFWLVALMLEIRKAFKDIIPHVINLRIFSSFAKSHEIETYDIKIDEKKFERSVLRGQISDLETRIEKMPANGEEMIS